MAHKQITTVRLERRPHRDAKQRLCLAYTAQNERSCQEVPLVNCKSGNNEVEIIFYFVINRKSSQD